MVLTSQIIEAIEERAPSHLQESFDNTGVQVGETDKECTGAMLCVDATPRVVDEAASKGCNLLISPHRLLYKGWKRISCATAVEVAVMKALRRGITIYSSHTAMDNACNGVSWEMARRLGLKRVRVLDRQQGKLMKLAVYVPADHAGKVTEALFAAGAGESGNYSCCSYSTQGTGTFKALEGARPYVGAIGELHRQEETRIEVILPGRLKENVERALLEAHPYQEPAYEFLMTENLSPRSGSGTIGEYDSPVTAKELAQRVKTAFSSPVARCNSLPQGLISRVAMCGGAGSFLIGKALAEGAQAFITSDTKYHDFLDYAGKIFVIDIGHFESEQCTKEIFYHIIREKFPTFALYYSELEKNPISYI